MVGDEPPLTTMTATTTTTTASAATATHRARYRERLTAAPPSSYHEPGQPQAPWAAA